MVKFSRNLDERSVRIIQEWFTVSHTIMTFLMIAMFLRRLHILGQSFDDNWDIGLLIILNGAFLLGGILYRGGINWPRFEPKWILLVYILFCFLVVMFKVAIEVLAKGRPFDLGLLTGQDLLVILVVCTVVAALFFAIAFFGKQKLEKDLE